MVNMANNFITVINGDLKRPIVLTSVEFDYQADTTTILDTNQGFGGIRLELDKSKFSDQSIQEGDYQVIFEQSGLTIDIRSDNTEMTYDGKSVSIENVDEDAGNATYTLHVRDK